MTAPGVAPGTVTGIGSLPHLDASAAARLVLELTPQLPAVPQLPARHEAEAMLAQAADGLDAASMTVDPPSFAGEAWTSLRVFLDAAGDRQRPIKLQMTGPVTFGLALLRDGLDTDAAFALAGEAVRARAAALVDFVSERVPHAPLTVFIDEPGLTAALRTDYPLTADATIDLLSGALAALGPDVVTGVHCCGPTDWRLAIDAGPDVLSLPVDCDVIIDAAVLSGFLERGAWVAWGVVPTHRPIGERADVLWRRLVDLWCDLTRAGCDPVMLRQQALVTPECGLARHDPAQVAAVFELAREVGCRIEDQAVACRLSVGA